ncbi:MAG: hypothetical protein LDL39_14140 [Magnetospirillum sp.]|nr:hypothetical protein [Magnetospirillum sp.]
MGQTAAETPSWRVQSPPPRSRHLAPVLSVLLHLLLALAWLGFPLPEPSKPEPPTLTVDIVPPSPPAPSPAQAPKAKPAEAGVPVPQLQDGELAEKSAPPPELKDRQPAPPDPAASQPAAKVKKPAPVTQNQRDWVLSRVLRHWRRPADLGAYASGDIRLAVKVMPDGHFSDIYDARRPWNPEDVFDGYGTLPPGVVQRRIIDSIYGAIRQAQPLKLTQELRDKAPFTVRLDFRFKDVR